MWIKSYSREIGRSKSKRNTRKIRLSLILIFLIKWYQKFPSLSRYGRSPLHLRSRLLFNQPPGRLVLFSVLNAFRQEPWPEPTPSSAMSWLQTWISLPRTVFLCLPVPEHYLEERVPKLPNLQRPQKSISSLTRKRGPDNCWICCPGSQSGWEWTMACQR